MVEENHVYRIVTSYSGQLRAQIGPISVWQCPIQRPQAIRRKESSDVDIVKDGCGPARVRTKQIRKDYLWPLTEKGLESLLYRFQLGLEWILFLPRLLH